MTRREEIIEQLKKDGTQKVREKLWASKYNLNDEAPVAAAWLSEEDLKLPKEANSIARWAIFISGMSLLISIISILITLSKN